MTALFQLSPLFICDIFPRGDTYNQRVTNLFFDFEASCFEQYPLKMKNGDKYFYITTSLPGRQSFQIQLPHELECWHCIIQWTYVAGELNKQFINILNAMQSLSNFKLLYLKVILKVDLSL